jgi:serine/threonine protein kinase
VYKGLRDGVQDVAVKVLQHTDEAMLKQFQSEIKLLRRISFDRNIVQFYGACLQQEDTMVCKQARSLCTACRRVCRCDILASIVRLLKDCLAES